MSIAQAAIEAQSGGFIVGLKTDKVLARLEIDEFVLDKDVLNLFLLALIQLQDDKIHKEAFSWYQIAGIHGRPFADWDQVHGKGRDIEERNIQVAAGYCSHSSVTFPTWHRPYVAMMEQAVYVAMVGIAKQYTDHATQQNYLNACTRFRFPYWDPCLPRQTGYDKYNFGIPQIVSNPHVWVRLPRDPESLVQENNPLYSYNFPKEVQNTNHNDFHWETMRNSLIQYGGNKHTVRAPRLPTETAETAETTDKDVDTYMSDHIQADVGSSLYKVLTVSQDWSTFSNDRAPIEKVMVADSQGRSDVHEIYHTVEGFHDNIHVHIGNGQIRGGSGHMGDPQLAAFDPIFWLHHCNIDRITAIWQARNPNAWWKEHAMARSDANWAVPAGHIQRPSDYLLPFRKSRRAGEHDEFWTSDAVRNWEDLGYTYMGKRINHGNSGNNEQVSFEIKLRGTSPKDLNAYCSQFYGWMDSSAVGVERPVPDLLYQFYPIDISQVEALTGKHSDWPPMPRPHPSRTPNDPKPDTVKPDYSHLHGLLLDGCLRQWNAYITVEKFALRSSFQIFIFIGDFCQNPDDWSKDPNLVGINGIFASDPKSGGCDNCERQAESSLLITDVVPLTGHLIKWIRSENKAPKDDPNGLVLKSLKPDDVMPFLYKNMHWRIATIHGEHKQRSEVPGLKVAVADQVVRLPKTFEDNPEYEDVAFQTGATHGRQGGLDHNEAMAQVRIS